MELKKKEERSFRTGKTQRRKKQRERGEIRLEDPWVGGIETAAGCWQDP